MEDPFHRVEVWNSTHFTPSWLWRSGLVLSLCPTGQCDKDSDIPPPEDALPPPGDTSFGAKPAFRICGDVRALTVVHTNGVHHLLVKFCSCAVGEEDPVEDDIQLLRARLYPASHREIRTAFTFAVMDNYLLDNLECYTSAFHYFSKLRRLTNEVFPKKVPVRFSFEISIYLVALTPTSYVQDRYREGLRCGRQWRRIKELKRHGFGHTKGVPRSGEMALFCAACPQAGKNLEEGWEEEPDQWRYNVTLVADGNFSLVHRAQKTVDDVWLKNGESYMVGPVEYKQHIRNAPEIKEVFIRFPTILFKP
jgi:CxC2 like cysteine cluster associated with KDZ transposases